MRSFLKLKGEKVMDKFKPSFGLSQLILYTKGHFEKESLFEDLKKITSKAFGLSEEHTDTRNVYSFVISAFLTLKEQGFIVISEHDFLLNLFKYPQDQLNSVGMMKKMLEQISLVEVVNMELYEADASILPLYQRPVYEIRIVRYEDDDDSFIVYGEDKVVNEYIKHILKFDQDDIHSDSSNTYESSEKMYKELEIAREDNPTYEVFDAHAYV